MRKAILILLAVCISVILYACTAKEETPAASIDNTAVESTSASEKEAAEVPEEPPLQAVEEDCFYEARAIPQLGICFFGDSAWGSDGSFWAQDLNVINVIGRDNDLVQTIALDESRLPPDYRLTWSENRILAIRNASENSWHEYGALYVG